MAAQEQNGLLRPAFITQAAAAVPPAFPAPEAPEALEAVETDQAEEATLETEQSIPAAVAVEAVLTQPQPEPLEMEAVAS